MTNSEVEGSSTIPPEAFVAAPEAVAKSVHSSSCGVLRCGACEREDEAMTKHEQEVRADEWKRALTHARACVTQYVATAEKWRYDRVVWAFGIMLGEIPEDSPCPRSPADDKMDRVSAHD